MKESTRWFAVIGLVMAAYCAPALAQSLENFSSYVFGLPAISSLAGTERLYALKGTLSETTTPQQILGLINGDCSNAPSIVCTKSNGVSFAPSATTDTTDAGNISKGTLATQRLPAPFTNGTASGSTSKFGTISGALTNGHLLKVDGSGNIVDGGSPNGSTNKFATVNGTLVNGNLVKADGSGNLIDGGLPGGTVTEQKNTAGSGLSTSGNCDNTSSNASNACQYSINPGNVPGISSGTAATAGQVGEVKQCNGTTAALTSSQVTPACNISLTPGDWDIRAYISFGTGGATSVTDWEAAISTTSGSLTNIPNTVTLHVRVPATNDYTFPMTFPSAQVLPSTTTTYYLNVEWVGSGLQPTASFVLSARRMR